MEFLGAVLLLLVGTTYYCSERECDELRCILVSLV